MRAPVKAFAKLCAETLPVCEPIYEFGAFQVPEQGSYADIRPYYPGRHFLGADMRKGPGVDVVLDLHDIALPDESAGTVLMYETLEHVEFPRKAVGEAFRILKPSGCLVMTSQMNFPIHEYPHDYWRFTPEAFKSLLRPFARSIVDFAGEANFPHIVIGVGFKAEPPENVIEEFIGKLRDWKSFWRDPRGKATARAIDWARTTIRPLLPEPVLRLYRGLRNGIHRDG